MRIFFLSLSLFIFSTILIAQDTIYLKSGEIIPAEIIEKSEAEIKYKKIQQLESVAIYSVFIVDIASIHYKNGTVVDYSTYDPNSNVKQEKESLKRAGSVSTMRLTFGLSRNYEIRNESDNLQTFWRYHNNDNSLKISMNNSSTAFNIGWGTALDGNRRNWFGAATQFIFTPSDAIFATNNYNGVNEIKLGLYSMNILFYYGHTLNHKKNLLVMFDPGIEIGMMSGFIKLHDTNYKVSGISGISAHLAIGIDWIITKRILASFRVGQRFMKIKESHENKASKTGFSSFYVNPSANNNLLNVDWGGSYINLGISYSMYNKMKQVGRPD